MKKKYFFAIVVLVSVLSGSTAGVLLGNRSSEPKSRSITIKARQYAYDPAIIRVQLGDTLTFTLVSMDVTHGFFLEGYDIDAEIIGSRKKFKFRHPSEGDEWTDVENFTFIADRRGKFRYRCSHTCGTMHPFMLGEFVVEPNSPYHASIGGVIGMFMGMIFFFGLRSRDGE